MVTIHAHATTMSLTLNRRKLAACSMAACTGCRVFMISVWRGEGGREEPELSTQHTIEITHCNRNELL